MHYAHNMCDPHWSTWHLLHGSRTFNSTVGGTIGLMYVWNAKIAWRASTSTCVHNKKHLPNLFTEHLGEPWVVSKVMSSSYVAAPTIWHINSTRLLVEKKLMIFTRFSMAWWCSGINLILEGRSVKIEGLSMRPGSTYKRQKTKVVN